MDFSEYETAASRARVRIMEKYCTRYYNSLLSQGQVLSVSSDSQWVKVYEYVTALTPSLKGHFLVTINPPTDDLSKLQSVIEHIRCYKNFVGDMTYCYEVRSPTGGLHVHIYADDVGKPKSDVIKRCYNASRKYFPNINVASVDVKHCNETALDYIHGIKKDEEKKESMHSTFLYRKANDLKPFYYDPVRTC